MANQPSLSTGAAGAAAPMDAVARTDEAQILEAALLSGTHVLLEGPPGTGKSTLLRQVAREREIPFVLVEGNSELTPARLIGHFDPALVLDRGYVAEIFEDGPLLDAMRRGGLLYVEELNRIPEETLNVLLAAMSEKEIAVPRLGRIVAAAGFGLVAAMNPFDTVGTARVSSALYDRTCRISMGYQSAEAERDIVSLHAPGIDASWRNKVVALVRASREHDALEWGSSVRGAIDIARIAVELARLRGVAVNDWHVGLAAAKVSLSGRIRLHDSAGRSPEDVVLEMYERVFGPEPAQNAADPDPEASPEGTLSPSTPTGSPQPTHSPHARDRPRGERTTGRSDLARNPRFAELSPEVGVLDQDALNSALAEHADETLTLIVEMSLATDDALRSQVRRLAPRLILEQTRRGLPKSSGIARRRIRRAVDGGDIDLDRSMDRVLGARAEGRSPRLDELLVSDWARPELALCLVIDRSGSMNGARLTTAAVAAAACASLTPREHAVITFAAHVGVLKPMNERRPASETVASILSLRGHGTTSLSAALDEAHSQLGKAGARRKVTLLLSDCRATEESGAVAAALGLQELIILAPGDDVEAARQLARAAGGTWAPVDTVLDVPRLLNRLMADDRV
ncbi:ATPase associated with various cellular activities, AAA_5 [Alloactinosynnema sp. L-07]|uniref:AAA family ATPase n=1 Tax=Alloactinosynnema sp. L-07 TaxID=1653480 RepID=UPI00065EFEC7|nr:AAA family ATPase [Alloactinosynnema sp. L-07]CRK56108.1 ATPase associated with various cellular activities, AAA_5 [Alloactinosynnema sp. L-07]